MIKKKYILVTGAAGFIGYNLVNVLSKKKNIFIIGIDNLCNNLYPIIFKKNRLTSLSKINNFKFYQGDIVNNNFLKSIFNKYRPTYVINLAAYAGVRQSFMNSHLYYKNNVDGFMNIIKISHEYNCKFIYASSSSIYNSLINKHPYSENYENISPQSIYGITKLNNELIADYLKKNNDFDSIGLRFFSVYGDHSRPDMAIYKFIDSIYKGKKIILYNHGKYIRDFTHVKDVTKIIQKILNLNTRSFGSIKILNIGSTNTTNILKLMKIIENLTNKKAIYELVDPVMNEPLKTHADMTKTFKIFGKYKSINLDKGLKLTYKWYLNYHSSK